MISIEEFKNIPGYEELYQVNKNGDVLALKFGTGKIKKILKPSFDKDGYRKFSLRNPQGNRNNFRGARLVLLTFLGLPDFEKPQANHKNGIRHDDRLENLEWVTCSENVLHSFRVLGKTPPMGGLGRVGNIHPRSKPVNQFDLNGNFIKQWESCNMAAVALEVDRRGISACASGDQNTAYGFIWKYVTE